MIIRALPCIGLALSACTISALPASAQDPGVAIEESIEDLVVLPRSWNAKTARDFRNLSAGFDANRALAVRLDSNEILVDPAEGFPDSAVYALTVSRSELATLESRVTQKFISEREGRPSFLGTLSDGVQQLNVQTFAFNPKNLGGSPLRPNTDPSFEMLDQSDPTSLGRAEKIAGALYSARQAGFDVRLDELSLLPDQYELDTQSSFEQQYNRTLASFSSAILDTSASSVEQFQSNVRLTHQEFVRQWPQLRSDPAARHNAVRSLRSLKRQSSLKALYGVESIFEPQSYDAIFKQSQRVVGVGTSGNPACSGLLVDSRWVLSAGHCLENLGVSDIRVFLDIPARGAFEGERNIRLKVQDRWPARGTGENFSDPIDYALLKIDETDLRSKSTAMEWLEKIQQAIPLCIRVEDANYRDAVIVIGRLRSDIPKVYDHAYIWFPFKVSEPQYEFLSAETGFGLQLFVEAWFHRNDWDREFDNRYLEFERAYRPLQGDAGRVFLMKRQRDMGERPYIGFDTDTVKGNSGSPIYSRVDNCLLGVFAGGVIDGAEFENSSWSRHEFGTPISAILADLAARGTERGTVAGEIADAREALLTMLTQ